MDDPGIIDEDVDVSEDVERGGHEVVDAQPVADIGDDECYFAEGREFLLGLFAGLFVEIGNRDLGAILEKPLCDRIANPSRAAGNDRDFSVNCHGCISLVLKGELGLGALGRQVPQ